MSDPKNVRFPLKVVINKQKTKLLYAEANSDFADVLLSFLTLPLGTIVRVLKKHNDALAFGSLTTLYNGVSNLDNVHFQNERCKEMLLNPRTSSEAARHKLKFNVDYTDRPPKYFRCADLNCSLNSIDSPHVTMYEGTPWIKCTCGKSLMNKEISLRDSTSVEGDGGGFTMRTAHFIITDDLQLLPSVTGDALRILSSLGITDMTGTEQMCVVFGYAEIMNLLKASLLSETPLTEIVLNKKHVDSVTAKNGTGTSFPSISTTSITKLIVKAILQKSTNKLLFAEADDNFVEFLFRLLTIPLGGIERLLGSITGLKNIDNIYRSLENINGVMYLKTQIMKTILLNPKLPHSYTSKNQFIPLIQETQPILYFYKGSHPDKDYLSFSRFDCRHVGEPVSFVPPKGPGNYVKGSTMFMVTDDLTVTPLCATSSLFVLNCLKIPYSDVKELELNIGMKEALSILRASLTSTCAITEGLIKPFLLKKQPKQEH